MNPEQAYVAHTDWVRAATQTGSNHHTWFRDRVQRHCRLLGPTAAGIDGVDATLTYRQYLTSDDSYQARLRLGPVVTVHIVVDYEPDPTPDDPTMTSPVTPTDVYADLPEPAPGSVQAQAVLVPEPVYTQGTLDMLAAAHTYYVSADMVTVIEVAAAAFDDYDLMPRMPTESGFVVLARPIEIPDFDGTQRVAAFAWTKWGDINTTLDVPGGVGDIWTFSARTARDPDPVADTAREQWTSKTAWRNDPDLLPAYADRYVAGEPVGPVIEDICVAQARSRVAQMTQQSWNPKIGPDGEPVDFDPQAWADHVTRLSARADQELARAHAQNGGPRMVGRMQPYLAAFVLLLTQQITHEEKEVVSDGSARLGRQVSPSRPSTVTVVDVRRSARNATEPGDHTDEEGVGSRRGLDHRHLVGSHWKWQPYGPQRSLRRRIFVTGYVRGPEDAPLKVRPKVTRLS